MIPEFILFRVKANNVVFMPQGRYQGPIARLSRLEWEHKMLVLGL